MDAILISMKVTATGSPEPRQVHSPDGSMPDLGITIAEKLDIWQYTAWIHHEPRGPVTAEQIARDSHTAN